MHPVAQIIWSLMQRLEHSLQHCLMIMEDCLHGRPEYLNSIVNFSLTGRSFNDKYDSWEPLVEAMDGFLRFFYEVLTNSFFLLKKASLHSEQLYISDNSFNGSLPPKMGNLSSLENCGDPLDELDVQNKVYEVSWRLMTDDEAEAA